MPLMSDPRPAGYGQHSPFTQPANPPGPQNQPAQPPGMGAGTPAAPVDPTLMNWRQPQMAPRQLGDPHGAPTPMGGGSPLQQAIAGGPATGGLGTPPPANPVQNGDYKDWFSSLTGGKPLNQAGLEALKPQLNAAGVQITPASAAGVKSKIGVPDGHGGTQWVRVLDGDTSQANPTVWMAQPGGGGGGQPSAAKAAWQQSLQTSQPNPLLAAIINKGIQPGQPQQRQIQGMPQSPQAPAFTPFSGLM